MGSYLTMCMQGKRSAKDVDQERVKQQKLYYYEKQLHKVRLYHSGVVSRVTLILSMINDLACHKSAPATI